MKKGEQKDEKPKAGMENLSAGGRVYIENLTEAMLLYQNSLGSSGRAGRPGKARTPQDAAALESTD
jgi:hypothetical protein